MSSGEQSRSRSLVTTGHYEAGTTGHGTFFELPGGEAVRVSVMLAIVLFSGKLSKT